MKEIWTRVIEFSRRAPHSVADIRCRNLGYWPVCWQKRKFWLNAVTSGRSPRRVWCAKCCAWKRNVRRCSPRISASCYSVSVSAILAKYRPFHPSTGSCAKLQRPPAPWPQSGPPAWQLCSVDIHLPPCHPQSLFPWSPPCRWISTHRPLRRWCHLLVPCSKRPLRPVKTKRPLLLLKSRNARRSHTPSKICSKRTTVEQRTANVLFHNKSSHFKCHSPRPASRRFIHFSFTAIVNKEIHDSMYCIHLKTKVDRVKGVRTIAEVSLIVDRVSVSASGRIALQSFFFFF